jgi:hypothetical protein
MPARLAPPTHERLDLAIRTDGRKRKLANAVSLLKENRDREPDKDVKRRIAAGRAFEEQENG